MLELPETYHLSKQINQMLVGKTINNVIVNYSVHKFAWLNKNIDDYHRLINKTIKASTYHGAFLEIAIGNDLLTFSDGVNLRYIEENQTTPQKHQLLLEFSDHSKLVASVQMYGFLYLLLDGKTDNPYYLGAKSKPCPLTDEFDEAYFLKLVAQHFESKLSLKAFLATEQRIPGVGNGVIQDILFKSQMLPKRKLTTLNELEIKNLYQVLKTTLLKMANQGGRNTETDLLGNLGGYQTLMSNRTIDQPCPRCFSKIVKEAYLGGSVYYCPQCQK